MFFFVVVLFQEKDLNYISVVTTFSDNLILMRAPKVPVLLPVGGALLAVIDLASNEVDSA